MRLLWERNRKHLLLRILQFSPLIPLMFNGIVWISVPGPLRGEMLRLRSYQRVDEFAEYITEDSIRQTVEWGLYPGLERAFDHMDVEETDRLPYYGERLVLASSGETQPLASLYEDSQPFPWASDNPMFEDIAQFDAESAADVYAFAVLRTGLPPLVAKSERAPSLLYATSEAELALLPPEYAWAQEFPSEYSLPPTPTVDPAMIDESWKVAWYSECYGYGDLAAFPDLLTGGGGGYSDERRYVSTFGHVSNGELFASVWISLPMIDEISSETNDPTSDLRLSSIDPTSPVARAVIEDMAKQYRCNGYLVGPIEGKFIPLWCREGNEDTAIDLANALTPGTVTGLTMSNGSAIPERVSDILGTGITPVVSATSGRAGDVGVRENGVLPEYPSPTVLLIAVYPDESAPGLPIVPDARSLGNGIRDVRIWLAMNMHWLLNLGIGTLALTLVISPTAFFYERNMIARQRLVEEMERVQRDAHDKVYNRLSALSKRVEMTSGSISSDVAQSLGGVAEDIRATVTDLQDILGDTRSRTAEIAGVDPLRSQLEHVCRAQAARLGVAVTFEAPETLPRLASQLGWDLQCVLEEAITNAAKHGGARAVRVNIDLRPAALELAVRDDGSGTGVADIDALPAKSTGLRGMRQRLLEHGGTLDIVSNEHGTTLLASVPLVTDAEDEIPGSQTAATDVSANRM
ncbi:MAG: hypothetical protein Q7J82_01800 [Coriobacteriia bacterium]|nr:hypothetical protein [Coriobacteriia bacterium]